MTSLSIIAGVNSWKSCALILGCKKKSQLHKMTA